MIEFDIVLYDIRLRVIARENTKKVITELMNGHSYIEDTAGVATYTLILDNDIVEWKHGEKIHMIDKWFDNASCDVWIDNTNRIVSMTNIWASSIKNKNLLIQYFACNLFNRLLEEKGYIAFHSSCVDKDGNGISFIGPRNSGKTNCMLNMMAEGYNSVTNDKLGILYNDDELYGYGVAQDVSIRMSLSFRNQPQNKIYIPYVEREGIKLSDKNLLDGNSIHLESCELATLNGVVQIPTTNIKHILFPKYNSEIKEVILNHLPPEEVRELILNQLLPIVHPCNEFLRIVHTNNTKAVDKSITIEEMLKLENYEIIQGENCRSSFVKTINKIMNN